MRLIVLFVPAALLLSLDASAQTCPGSATQIAADCASSSFAGCCDGPNVVKWCEGGVTCQIDCSGNTGGGQNCCQPTGQTGCCDAAIQACVCGKDSWCCDIEWDALCVNLVPTCGGACPMGCPGPATVCGWKQVEGYYDCNTAPAADPSGQNPMMCGAGGCIPSCDGKTCGPDGCGNQCGFCPVGVICNGFGQCEDGCAPKCQGKQCGPDGCGGSCGTCGGAMQCNAAGLCAEGCAPDCFGKQCGDDGCGGICGTCQGGQSCDASGKCAAFCPPDCAGKQCGDDGCGGSCGECSFDKLCNASGLCVDGCTPDCAGKNCGSDGCDGTCGQCIPGYECGPDGKCFQGCAPDCTDKVCGDDGCGNTCGSCPPSDVCEAGQCKPAADPCKPDCDGKTCGPDGCQGVCGVCQPPFKCDDATGACIDPESCAPDCIDKFCGPDGCGGTCGECEEEQTCAGGQCLDANSEDPTETQGNDDSNQPPDPTGGTGSGSAGTQGDCPAGYVIKLNGKCVKDETLSAAHDGTVNSGGSRGGAASGCATAPARSGAPLGTLGVLSLLLLALRTTSRRPALQRSPSRRR